MRMDNSWPRDLAMSASAEVGTGMTYALFHGCDEQDVKVLTEWLQITAYSAGHPLLLPALFVELQLRRHKSWPRTIGANWWHCMLIQVSIVILLLGYSMRLCGKAHLTMTTPQERYSECIRTPAS